tara:strand:+ start:356 stop:1351 length:996 start_codon:yes stop_codon:yes gene_type:complete
MAWKRKTGVDTTTSLPTGLASWRKISSYIKQLIKASQFEYHESEAFEVKNNFINNRRGQGVVSGTFLNNPNQSIFDGIVYPINSNITNIPLIGEQVAVIEYNGKHFYTDIINRKNSPNENAIPGASGGYNPNTKYGDTFERKDVKKIHVNEGDIVYEGRFGTSIKLGSDGKNKATGGPKPQIKIVAGHRDIALHLATQNIDEDDSSIYLLGAVDKSEGKDKKILIKSNGIFITGRDEIRLNSNKINLNSDEIKIGNDADQSVVRGDDLKQFLDDLLSDLDLHFTSAMAAITPGGVIVTGGAAASPVFKVGIQAIKTKLATNKMLSDKVKTT